MTVFGRCALPLRSGLTADARTRCAAHVVYGLLELEPTNAFMRLNQRHLVGMELKHGVSQGLHCLDRPGPRHQDHDGKSCSWWSCHGLFPCHARPPMLLSLLRVLCGRELSAATDTRISS